MSAKEKTPGQIERKYQRATSDFPAKFTWGAARNVGVAAVLSMGGCFIASDAIIPQGEELDVEIDMSPEFTPLHCRAAVVWTEKRGVKIRGGERSRGFAIEFLRIFPEDREKIEEYVRSQTRVFKAIDHELKKKRPDLAIVKELFAAERPGESTHLNHIRKVVSEELKYFKLRK